MAKKENGTEIPEGYEVVSGGSFAPFFNLGIGSSLEGVLQRARVTVEKKTIKVKGKPVEAEEDRYYFDIKLTAPADGDDGSRQHNPVSYDDGDSVTINGSGSMIRAFHKAALKAQGEKIDALPDNREEWPAPEWDALAGRAVFIRRENDDKMKKGKWKGNKVKVYTVGFKLDREPVAA